MLLDEIITILSSTTSNLTEALLKTKILLHQLGRKDLVPWVNNELTGYPDNNVPSYRIVPAQVYGNFSSVAWRTNSQPMPISHLKPETQKRFTVISMKESLPTIEEAIKKYEKSPKYELRRVIAPELMGIFQAALANGVVATSAWSQLNMNSVINILPQVRSRLLGFSLELRDAVGSQATETQLQQKAATVDTKKLFQMTILGDNATVVVGDHNTTVTNTKGDIQGLLKALSKIGATPSELTELEHAVQEDQSKGLTPDISEGKTNGWFMKLLKRAGKGTLNVGVDVFTSIVVKALAAYTGDAS